MICEKQHWYHTPKSSMKSSRSPLETTMPYIGYIAESEYIGHNTTIGQALLAVIRRDKWLMTKPPEADVPKLPVHNGYGGYHSSELNSNCAIKFTRDDLKQLIESMNENDELVVYGADHTFDTGYFNGLRKSQ